MVVQYQGDIASIPIDLFLTELILEHKVGILFDLDRSGGNHVGTQYNFVDLVVTCMCQLYIVYIGPRETKQFW